MHRNRGRVRSVPPAFALSVLAIFFLVWFAGVFFVYRRQHSSAQASTPDSMAELVARTRREFDAMRVDYCADWKEKKGIDCPESIPSSDGHLMLLHGHLKCHFGDTPGAIISTQHAVEMVPDYTEAHYQLFKIQQGVGDFSAARAHLQEVLRVKPDNWEAMTSLQYLEHQLVATHAMKQSGMTNGLDRRVCQWLQKHNKKLGFQIHTALQEGVLCNFFDDEVWRPLPWQYPEDLAVSLKEQFWRDRYLIVKSVLPQPLLSYFQMFYRVVVNRFEKEDWSGEHGELTTEAEPNFITSNKRYEFSTADVANFVNMQLTPYISKLVGQTLLPIYAFPVVYVEGGGIEPHRDVSENEISLSMQVALSPDNWTWPLTVERPRDYYQEVANLGNNEGVLYHGTEVLHWRDSFPPEVLPDNRPKNLPEQYKLVQIVFAWRRVNKQQCVSQ